uniref:CCHC-type domain-containing protein n=1 Tax=Tanacetum cinerariifolium TaxID=118510 RepID=A0A6L2JLW1_TANCI|nr:hypothetical protein [Tanacetum cinerariifolium]
MFKRVTTASQVLLLQEVILKGDSPPPTRIVDDVVQIVAPTTVEQRLAKKNELKARETLLMALLDKHPLKFNIHKDAKSLMEAIEKIFGGRHQLEILKKSAIRIYEAEVKGSSTSSQNIAFVSSNNTDNTTESVNVAPSVSTASSKAKVSTLPNEMDLKWQMTMLTMRARRFLKKTGRNLGENGTNTIGFDMSKVECYNCHSRGHFSRKCRSPRDNKNKEAIRRTVPVEVSTLNALVSQCDVVGGYDWSFQAEKEPTNYAIIALTSLGSSSSSGSNNEVAPCSKAYSKSYATLQTHYENLTVEYRKSQLNVISYKIGLEPVEVRLVVYQQNETVFEEDVKLLKLNVMLRDNALAELRKKFEKAEKERNDLKLTLEKFENSSKNLKSDTRVTKKQENDRYKTGKGYHVVPPLYTGNFLPLKPDFVFTDDTNASESVANVINAEESVKKVEHTKHAKNLRTNNQKSRGHKNNWKNKACFVCRSFNRLIKDCDYYERQMIQKLVWNSAMRVNHQNSVRMTHPHSKRIVVPIIVLTRSRLVSLNAVKPVITAVTQSTMKCTRAVKNVFHKAHSPVRMPINQRTTTKNSNFNKKVTTVKVNKVNAFQGNKGNAEKASVCWVWKPKCKVLDHVSRLTSASVTFKKFDYTDALGRSNSSSSIFSLVIRVLSDGNDKVIMWYQEPRFGLEIWWWIYGSESRPPMLNKENYVPWSSRLLMYAKSRPNGKLIHNSILNGPYVRRMIPEPGDANREVTTILLSLSEDIYAAVDSCETAQEIWLRVQQMMKGPDIGIQEKKAKLFNEWERFTSNEGESIESYYHHLLKLMNDLKRKKHFPEKIATDYTQLYDFLKYNQKEVDELKAEQLAKSQDPLALMANSNNPYAFPSPHQDQSSFNQNYLQQPMPNPKDITYPTTVMNMELALMAKAFKLNYSKPTKNNQRISSNPRNRQIAQPGMNMGQDRQMQMVRGNGGNQFRQYVGHNGGNLIGYNNVQNIRNQNQIGNGNLVAARAEGNAVGQNRNQIRCYNCRGVVDLDEIEEVNANCILIANLQQASTLEKYDLMAAAADLDEIKEVNANCILMANLQQASTSGTQTDSAPVYNSDGSAENDNDVISDDTSVEQGGEIVKQHPANFKETHDELSDKEIKQIEADDQAIQTILLGHPEDIYAWLRVQQMMKGSDIGIQVKKAKLFNEWERFTSNEGESIESYYHRFLKLMTDLKRNKHFPEKIASNLKFLNNLQPEWSRHVTIVNQAKDLHIADYTQLYDFLKYNQKENVGNQNGLIGVQGNGNQNQIGYGNLVAARAERNAAGQNGNQIRCYNCKGVCHYARNCTVNPRRRDAAYLQTQLLIAQNEEAGIQLQAEKYDLMAAAADLDEIEKVNANCILMANLQQASTLGTQTNSAPVYNSDGSAEVHNYENCYENEIFNMFTQEEQYTELLKPIPKSHQVPQNDNDIISDDTSVEQGGEIVKQHPANFKETRALYETLY